MKFLKSHSFRRYSLKSHQAFYASTLWCDLLKKWTYERKWRRYHRTITSHGSGNWTRKSGQYYKIMVDHDTWFPGFRVIAHRVLWDPVFYPLIDYNENIKVKWKHIQMSHRRAGRAPTTLSVCRSLEYTLI